MPNVHQKNENETYSEEETKRRADAALKRMLQTPHKPHKAQRKSAPPKPRSKA
jgi:hypothetical protein